MYIAVFWRVFILDAAKASQIPVFCSSKGANMPLKCIGVWRKNNSKDNNNNNNNNNKRTTTTSSCAKVSEQRKYVTIISPCVRFIPKKKQSHLWLVGDSAIRENVTNSSCNSPSNTPRHHCTLPLWSDIPTRDHKPRHLRVQAEMIGVDGSLDGFLDDGNHQIFGRWMDYSLGCLYIIRRLNYMVLPSCRWTGFP